MKRICRLCKDRHNRQHSLCGSCVKVKAAHNQEVMRQEGRLMRRGWLPSGMATGRPAYLATAPIILHSNTSSSTDN